MYWSQSLFYLLSFFYFIILSFYYHLQERFLFFLILWFFSIGCLSVHHSSNNSNSIFYLKLCLFNSPIVNCYFLLRLDYFEKYQLLSLILIWMLLYTSRIHDNNPRVIYRSFLRYNFIYCFVLLILDEVDFCDTTFI